MIFEIRVKKSESKHKTYAMTNISKMFGDSRVCFYIVTNPL
jgi:hypothetical protein